MHLLLAELLVPDVPARRRTRDLLPFLAAFNVGAIAGTATWGRLSEGRLGRRGAFTATLILGPASLPFFLYGGSDTTLIIGALTMGFFGMGVWGMAPAYTVERFPTAGARRRSGLHLPRRRRDRRVDAVAARSDAGPRLLRRQRHERDDGRIGGRGDGDGVDRPGDARAQLQ